MDIDFKYVIEAVFNDNEATVTQPEYYLVKQVQLNDLELTTDICKCNQLEHAELVMEALARYQATWRDKNENRL